jgi:hypothetical protein
MDKLLLQFDNPTLIAVAAGAVFLSFVGESGVSLTVATCAFVPASCFSGSLCLLHPFEMFY